jgi:hypothetical protein
VVVLEPAAPVVPTDGRPKDAAPAAPATVAAVASSPAFPSQKRLRLEAALAAGARAGDGQRGITLEARVAFDMGGWLVGLEGAAAQYERTNDGPSGASSLLIGVLAGRRFRFEAPASPSIDLAAGPALAMRGIGDHEAVRAPAGTGAEPPAPDEGPWARLVAGARVNFRLRSLVRPFAGLDGEIALARWAAAPSGGEPRLPNWTIGLVVGAAVGAP